MTTPATPAVTMEQLQAALAVLKMADPALQASIGASLIPAAPLPYVGQPLNITPWRGKDSGKVQTLRIGYPNGFTKEKDANGKPVVKESAVYLNLDSLAIVLTNAAAIRKALVESLGHFHADCFEVNSIASYQQALAAAKLGE